MAASCQILEPSDETLNFCARTLGNGRLVAVPTETVYGLAANALDELAVRRIFEVKGRPFVDPLIVHLQDASMAESCACLNSRFHTLAKHFWPGPLTVLLHKRPKIPSIVTAGLPGVALRVPSHPVLQELLSRIDFPLAAPSANPFGYVSPTRPEHVRRTLGDRLSCVLDGGPCPHGLESTIVDLRNETKPAILRHGPLEKTRIEELLQHPLDDLSGYNSAGAQCSPGRLKKHYSPKTNIRLLEHGTSSEALNKRPPNADNAYILCRRPKVEADTSHVFWLSEDGDLATMAHNLFDLIQRLDDVGYKRLHLEEAPEEGIGRAINDRLRRAAAQ
ncbi:MAG: L-threonylcarbamoyladenylate synthase [Opitutales bacterium]